MEVLGLFLIFSMIESWIKGIIQQVVGNIFSNQNRILMKSINEIERKLDLILNYHGVQPEILKEDISADLILEYCPAHRKIEVLKKIREVTGLGLKEAKELVENCPSKIILDAETRKQPRQIALELESIGASVSLVPPQDSYNLDNR